MESVFTFIRRLLESSERREQERKEAYLAGSTDLYDLEYRMRELERQDRRQPAWMSSSG